jgi:uncharacterized protein YfaS (alpha-2-macroglobulin family)
MRRIIILALLGTFLLSLAAAAPQSASVYDKLKADAEREYAEKSFRRAHELYQQAAKLELTAADRRWVDFRLADTTLRADAAAPSEDATVRAKAREALQKLIAAGPDDELRADMNEALGDSFLNHPYERNAYGAQQWYLAALEFWAGSSDLDKARRRYLDIVWKMSGDDARWNLPRNVLVNAVQIAESRADRARARFLLAQQLANDGSPASVERALELLQEIIALGRGVDEYDDALYLYGATLMNERGADDPNVDYAKALEVFRRILAEFKPTETQYYDEARNAVRELTTARVSLFATGTFLPDSEQEVILSTRNVKEVQLALYGIDLTREARLDAGREREWTQRIAVEGRTAVRSWTVDMKDTGDHRPRREDVRLQPRLEPGAYLLVAAGGGAESARQLVLVTDAHILVHQGQARTDVFVSDVETGEPIANARVHISQRVERRVVETEAQTNANGLATFTGGERSGETLITAAAGARQAYHLTYSYYGRGNREPEWRVYAFTDRPAYRPGETVHWKIIARVRENEQWMTPAGSTLDYEITDPRGQKLTAGIATLTSFGSYWADLPLTESMPLGSYTITFKSKTAHRGAAELFRLEEYKLPEFEVKVSTPEGRQYRLGDTVEATIDASYYFGGPVASATVEAVVWQEPFYRYWTPWRKYPWYYEQPPQYGGGTILRRETLTTDANGRAVLRIDTPHDATDMSYRIEARVVDASRREVRGEGTVRVTRQRYTVMAHPEHYVHRPGDSVSIDFKALDANDQPVVATGTVEVFLRKAVERPPVPVPQPRPMTRRGRPTILPVVTKDEKISEGKVTTNAAGEATFTFTPKTVGHYVVRWTSADGPRVRDRVTAETAVWVADRATTELGYRTGGLDLIVDKETLRAGEVANIMVVTPASGRWVVFSTAGDDILDTQVLRMDGTVRLVQLPVDARHIPNFFVTATSVFDRNVMTDSERIAVPPVEKFLTVDVKSDREEYQPRQEGTVTITTRDVDGRPVSAEVALSVSDEAVTAIQRDPAGDPRQFFYGQQRGNPMQVSAALHSQNYVRLEEQPEETEEQKAERDGGSAVADSIATGAVGALAGNRMAKESAAMAPPPPPAPAPVAPQSRAEAITVTAEAPMVDVQVRSDFRSTAFWKPDLVTGADGTATVKVPYPEALTTWRATARAATAGSQFGMGSSTARTSMPLLARLQGPRFFVVGDRVVVSAVINNNTDAPQTVTPALEVEGLAVEGTGAAPLVVPARGEARADWTVRAEKAGPAKLRVNARSATHGDAMERAFTVYEHGIDKLIARSGKMTGDDVTVRVDLPRERRGTDFVVQVAPSLAVTMLDALPYLIEFPYGCTEQTMSRFLPAAIVARTLEQLNLGRARLAGKDLDAVTAQGMARLYDMQHGDGGWGWWKEGDSDPFMTAYVVWGFAIARDGGLRVDTARVERGADWLDTRLVRAERAYNDQAWMLHALSAWRKAPTDAERRAFDNVWTNREKLTAYSRALLALTAHRWNDAERARVLIRNLEDGVQLDAENNTAHWGASGFWWRWYESPVETTAFALQALVTIEPKHRLVEPVMNWLVRNRRGAQWNNTRDTAIALLALNDYLKASGELAGDVSYELTVNGKVIATKSLTAADVLRAPSRFTVPPDVLRETTQEVRIRRTSGKSPLYYAAEARFVSLEEPVTAAGNELFVKRQYFRLKPRPTLLKGVQYDRVPLRDQESVASGDRIEVVLTIETKNDYSYLMFEDLKPAGFEAVELQSGTSLFARGVKSGQMRWVHRELRDRKVALFADQLSQGTWEIQYTMRAEVPGSFHALPLLGQAMYVPDVRGNGDEVRVTVTDE